MSDAAKIDRTQVFAERLNDAKKYAHNLKSWFEEHESAAIDEHGVLDIVKCRQHLEKLLSLANAGKTLTAEEEGLVMEYAQVGRAFCTICGKWNGHWMCPLDEALYPQLCESCADYSRDLHLLCSCNTTDMQCKCNVRWSPLDTGR